jgi:hypothetical protein
LLAIAQGGVENDEFVSHENSPKKSNQKNQQPKTKTARCW